MYDFNSGYDILKNHEQRIHEISLREDQLRAKRVILDSQKNPLVQANLISISVVVISLITLVLLFGIV